MRIIHVVVGAIGIVAMFCWPVAFGVEQNIAGFTVALCLTWFTVFAIRGKIQ